MPSRGTAGPALPCEAMSSPAFDPLRPDPRPDPYPLYRELRERPSLYRAPDSGVWCVARYDDVQQVLRSPERFSSRAMFTMLLNNGYEGPPPLGWRQLLFLGELVLRTRLDPRDFATARNLIAEDGDRHTGMRNLVNRGFTPRQIADWEARAREVVAGCMTRLRRGERFDLMADLAVPLGRSSRIPMNAFGRRSPRCSASSGSCGAFGRPTSGSTSRASSCP